MRRLSATLVATLALVAAMLTTPPAYADGPHDGPVSVDTTVPPGGTSLLTTQTIPKNTTVLEVQLVPQAGATQAEVDTFDGLGESMGQMTKGKRLLACIMIYNSGVTTEPFSDHYGESQTYQVQYGFYALLMLVACLHLAGLLGATSDPTVDRRTPTTAAPTLRKAMTKCVRGNPGIPATVTEQDGVWTLTADGTVRKTRNKLKIGCKTKSGRTVIKVRAAKKGTPLRKVTGKRPRFGIYNPDTSSSAPVTVTFDPE